MRGRSPLHPDYQSATSIFLILEKMSRRRESLCTNKRYRRRLMACRYQYGFVMFPPFDQT